MSKRNIILVEYDESAARRIAYLVGEGINMTLSNLPPGCSDYDIEVAAGAFDEDEQPDRYRRDSLGFTDEGLNFAVSGEVKASSIPADAQVWGELFIDAAGGTNFKFHVEKGIGFERARRCLERFVAIIQQRIDTAKKCPFFEPEKKGKNDHSKRNRRRSPGAKT